MTKKQPIINVSERTVHISLRLLPFRKGKFSRYVNVHANASLRCIDYSFLGNGTPYAYLPAAHFFNNHE